MIPRLFGKREDRLAPVRALFARIAEASRRPELYRDAGVPDSFEGRFDSLCLHMFLVLRRLRDLPPPAADLAQDLVDACFSYLETGFRQGGVGDVSVPRRMKTIARSFYGRVNAFEGALASGDRAALVAALARNVAPEGDAQALADHADTAAARLAGLDLDGLLASDALFPPFASPRSAHEP